jgi:transcriptional regulator of aromatic amino acid metabolism
MIPMHSPDVLSLSDAMLLQALTSFDRRPNLLVVCADVPVDTVIQRLLEFCAQPFHFCDLSDGLRLPSTKHGTFFLTDVAVMSRQQQLALFDWTTENSRVQVISVTSLPVHQLVESGDFLEGLFYRLNIVCLEATARPRLATRSH